jgi:hypothetical protein
MLTRCIIGNTPEAAKAMKKEILNHLNSTITKMVGQIRASWNEGASQECDWIDENHLPVWLNHWLKGMQIPMTLKILVPAI